MHAQEWIPEGEVKAVVQICHGMVEYIDRYDEFARYLNDRGYYVTGNDHLGHGKTAHDKADLDISRRNMEIAIFNLIFIVCGKLQRRNIRMFRIICLDIAWAPFVETVFNE